MRAKVICPYCRDLIQWDQLVDHLFASHQSRVLDLSGKNPKAMCPCGCYDLRITEPNVLEIARFFVGQIIAEYVIGAKLICEQGVIEYEIVSEPKNISPYAFWHHIAKSICV